ncbi:MAG: phosphoribosylformylglycinamidine synthase [Bacteroidales bacterium]|nr:phosphoribosylformylglycinamidine synthase [Bacteroidales bacterium]
MITCFQQDQLMYVVESQNAFSPEEEERLSWLFSGAVKQDADTLHGVYIGPRREMITPWSTNAVDITRNMGVKGIVRMELFRHVEAASEAEALAQARRTYDPMLQQVYQQLNQDVFRIEAEPEPIRHIDDLRAYTLSEGLALSEEEIQYLERLSAKIGRKLTDSEVFGFSQVNSEHCRHKIFGGTYIIDGDQKPYSLFQMIKQTSQEHPNRIVSAYKDNVAFVQGPKAMQFAPKTADKPDYFEEKEVETVLSLKAETHNFPTTVEPFNGAATGSGGEIRDRMGGGVGSIPMAGTAVYMTSYPRLDSLRLWEETLAPRPWLYQTPEQILIKASNGASDFGNKFGQPLITGSLLTFEHQENGKNYGYDKVIMLAGGVGFANKRHAIKQQPEKGEKMVVLGGDNYRIGMGGGAVSSVATGEYASSIELNAVQRSNPEMQKRVFNALRAMAERTENPIVSLHDHGAGGHLNCLSELIEDCGGKVDIEKLPVGDPTLSAKEIIGNESQERMGLLIREKDLPSLERAARRERSPMYVVGEASDDHRMLFTSKEGNPIDLAVADMLGNPPKTIIRDESVRTVWRDVPEQAESLPEILEKVLRMESVACKDWLTNKVDRSVTGKVAKQQCCGPLQLPLNDVGVMALDYRGEHGIATALGHAPMAGLIDAASGSVLSIAEALTNIVWAPLDGGLDSVSLSANWMWPCKNKGEDARLYQAVEAASRFARALGINIPTGKDSLSMTQKYKDGEVVYAPGTVIITAMGEVSDVKKTVSPVLRTEKDTELLYVDFSADDWKLGGSVYAQVYSRLGSEAPTVRDADYFRKAFQAVQQLVTEGKVLAGHDVSAGGLMTAMLEMCFADDTLSLEATLEHLPKAPFEKQLFAENPAVLLQVRRSDNVLEFLQKQGMKAYLLGHPNTEHHHPQLGLTIDGKRHTLLVDTYRDIWYETSYLLDCKQSGETKAQERYDNYKSQQLCYRFPATFTGSLAPVRRREKAAILREQGTNGDREMAYSLYLAGFEVKDVHISDLMEGRENLEEISMLVFPGGFSYSDVLGSAKGWAGSFIYNPQAHTALQNFFAREDTLSLGVCNGCQLMVELGLLYPEHEERPRMLHNDSHKFESAFVNVNVVENHSVMLSGLAGSRLGIWVAHGEGKFHFPYTEGRYHIPMKYSYSAYPGNPNGSAFNAAAICSADGRHLAMMPHLERAIFPWQWAYYAEDRAKDSVSPWIEAFVNARKWLEDKHSSR